MKHAKIILLIITIGCSCSLASPSTIVASSTGSIVAASNPTTASLLAANLFKWLDELFNGAQSARRVSGDAYRYTQHEDRRGSERGMLYYIAIGIWRLAAAAGAAAIAGKAVEKQGVSAQTKNVVFIAPFLVGLIWPLVALAGAGIVWMACGEKKTEPPTSG